MTALSSATVSKRFSTDEVDPPRLVPRSQPWLQRVKVGRKWGKSRAIQQSLFCPTLDWTTRGSGPQHQVRVVVSIQTRQKEELISRRVLLRYLEDDQINCRIIHKP